MSLQGCDSVAGWLLSPKEDCLGLGLCTWGSLPEIEGWKWARSSQALGLTPGEPACKRQATEFQVKGVSSRQKDGKKNPREPNC